MKGHKEDTDVTSAEASEKDKLRSTGDEDRVCRERERGMEFQAEGTEMREHGGGKGGFEDLLGVTRWFGGDGEKREAV